MNDNKENLLVDLVREIMDAINLDIESCIPCIVTKVTSRKKVTVKSLIKLVAKNGKSYERAVIEGVPVHTAGAGDWFVSFPVKAGDIGWLNASDRDLSLFLQSYEMSEPSTKRMHSFSDSRFIPDIMTNFEIAQEDEQSMVIQNRAGTVKISLSDSVIKIKNNDVSLVVSDSAITGVAAGGFDLNGFKIGADGAAESPVSITAPSAVINGKELAGHDHGPGSFTGYESTPIAGTSGGNN